MKHGAKTGVYAIVNEMTGKRYVGSSSRSFGDRWRDHRRALRKNEHKNKPLQAAWNKHGASTFKFEILEICPRELCIAREQFWIDSFALKYNVCLTAASRLGMKHTQATKDRISLSKKGTKYGPHSNETRRKISAALKGRTRSAEEVATHAAAMERRRGISQSADTIERRVVNLRGRKRPPDVVAKYLAKLRSPEVRAKLAEAARRQWRDGRSFTATAEGRRNQSEKKKLNWAAGVYSDMKRDSRGRMLPKEPAQRGE